MAIQLHCRSLSIDFYKLREQPDCSRNFLPNNHPRIFCMFCFGVCKKQWFVGIALVCLTFASCGPKYTNATVKGVLRIDGKPAPRGVKLMFQPEGPGGSPSYGYTNDNGEYTLRFNAQNKGANAGKNLVSIGVEMQFDDNGEPELVGDLADIRARLPDKVSFNSELYKTIELGPNTIDIDVELDNKKKK